MGVKKFVSFILIIAIIIGAFFWIKSKENNEIISNDKSYSGDVNESGEIAFNKVEYVNEINLYTEEIEKKSGDRIQYNALATTDELGNDIESFITSFDALGAYSTFNIVKNRLVEIVPASDFLDIQGYYYRDGNLVMYKREFMGIGGNVKYYFKDGELVALITKIEPEMDFTPEKSAEILKRASNNYEDFFTSDFYFIELSDGKLIKLGAEGNIVEDIGKRIVSSGDTKTDWESITIKNVKYDDFYIRIVNSSVEEKERLMNITTYSNNVSLPKNLKIGISLEQIEASLNRPIQKIESLEYNEEYYDFEFDTAYVYVDMYKNNREIIFYMKEDKLVAVEMQDALDA